jgi:hypothetical protein
VGRASKELTEVMHKPETDSDVIWDTVELLVKGTTVCNLVP